MDEIFLQISQILAATSLASSSFVVIISNLR